MANITVSVPEDVYRAARIRAAEQDTSVSALVAAYLRSLSAQDAEFEQLAAQQTHIVSKIQRFNATDRLSRDEVHERGVR